MFTPVEGLPLAGIPGTAVLVAGSAYASGLGGSGKTEEKARRRAADRELDFHQRPIKTGWTRNGLQENTSRHGPSIW